MFLLVLFMLVLFPEAAQEGAREGLRFAFETVIASILPFSVIACALVYSGFAQKMGKFCAPLFEKLSLNPYGAVALFAGLLGGYPTGCKVVCDMYREGLVDKDGCEKMLSYVNNGGLIFAINVCGQAAFGLKKIGIGVFCASVASTLVTALILGRDKRKNAVFVHKKEKLPFMAVLGKSIASGGGVIVNIVSSFVVFYALSAALKLENIPVIEGVVEMTKGIMYSGQTRNVPLMAFFFTLGGVGVFAQSAALCSEYGISLKGYVKGKMLSSAIAFLVAYMAVNRPFFGKEIVALSLLVVVASISCLKLIKKLYASA